MSKEEEEIRIGKEGLEIWMDGERLDLTPDEVYSYIIRAYKKRREEEEGRPINWKGGDPVVSIH